MTTDLPWRCHRFNFAAAEMRQSPLVMGIVNLTHDSFSQDGCYRPEGDWLKHSLDYARTLVDQGAAILDLGAESTRPGSPAVDAEQEWQRLAPIIRELTTWNIPLSVDTQKPEIMRRALDAGVDIINDINGFRGHDRAGSAWSVLAGYQAGAIIMHMQGQPATMQQAPHYEDVVAEVAAFLEKQQRLAIMSGVSRDRLAFDLGFGFGKTFAHNRALFTALRQFVASFSPLVVGVSRKSMLGQITGLPVAQRMSASVVAAVLAADAGARVVRVHDVADTVAGLAVWRQLGQIH